MEQSCSSAKYNSAINENIRILGYYQLYDISYIIMIMHIIQKEQNVPESDKLISFFVVQFKNLISKTKYFYYKSFPEEYMIHMLERRLK